jgi:hypothetical protein
VAVGVTSYVALSTTVVVLVRVSAMFPVFGDFPTRTVIPGSYVTVHTNVLATLGERSF